MDPMKEFGGIFIDTGANTDTKLEHFSKENVEREDRVRRNYKDKFGFLANKELNKFYHPNDIAYQITQNNFHERCPYRYTGQGDSYFVSQDMYNASLATCRCGRPKSNVHIIKCLQKLQSKYSDDATLADLADDRQARTSVDKAVEAVRNAAARKVPETTSGTIGRLPSRYKEWERSTYYVSPKYTMPGYRIVDHPYSNIIIG